MPDNSKPVHEQVGAIIAAAEEAAARIRRDAEQRLRDRIAEAERAGEQRVQAAEAEAAEILEAARAEAVRLRESGRSDGAKAVSAATGEALTVIARAQEEAEKTINEAKATAARDREQSEQRSRELLSEARAAAAEVRTEGLELVGNLREMGDSLRTNADRLLRDVLGIHSRIVAQIDRVDGGRGAAAAGGSRTDSGRRGTGRERDAPEISPDGEVLDVPEFIPPA